MPPLGSLLSSLLLLFCAQYVQAAVRPVWKSPPKHNVQGPTVPLRSQRASESHYSNPSAVRPGKPGPPSYYTLPENFKVSDYRQPRPVAPVSRPFYPQSGYNPFYNNQGFPPRNLPFPQGPFRPPPFQQGPVFNRPQYNNQYFNGPVKQPPNFGPRSGPIAVFIPNNYGPQNGNTGPAFPGVGPDFHSNRPAPPKADNVQYPEAPPKTYGIPEDNYAKQKPTDNDANSYSNPAPIQETKSYSSPTEDKGDSYSTATSTGNTVDSYSNPAPEAAVDTHKPQVNSYSSPDSYGTPEPITEGPTTTVEAMSPSATPYVEAVTVAYENNPKGETRESESYVEQTTEEPSTTTASSYNNKVEPYEAPAEPVVQPEEKSAYEPAEPTKSSYVEPETVAPAAPSYEPSAPAAPEPEVPAVQKNGYESYLSSTEEPSTTADSYTEEPSTAAPYEAPAAPSVEDITTENYGTSPTESPDQSAYQPPLTVTFSPVSGPTQNPDALYQPGDTIPRKDNYGQGPPEYSTSAPQPPPPPPADAYGSEKVSYSKQIESAPPAQTPYDTNTVPEKPVEYGTTEKVPESGYDTTPAPVKPAEPYQENTVPEYKVPSANTPYESGTNNVVNPPPENNGLEASTTGYVSPSEQKPSEYPKAPEEGNSNRPAGPSETNTVPSGNGDNRQEYLGVTTSTTQSSYTGPEDSGKVTYPSPEKNPEYPSKEIQPYGPEGRNVEIVPARNIVPTIGVPGKERNSYEEEKTSVPSIPNGPSGPSEISTPRENRPYYPQPVHQQPFQPPSPSPQNVIHNVKIASRKCVGILCGADKDQVSLYSPEKGRGPTLVISNLARGEVARQGYKPPKPPLRPTLSPYENNPTGPQYPTLTPPASPPGYGPEGPETTPFTSNPYEESTHRVTGPQPGSYQNPETPGGPRSPIQPEVPRGPYEETPRNPQGPSGPLNPYEEVPRTPQGPSRPSGPNEPYGPEGPGGPNQRVPSPGLPQPYEQPGQPKQGRPEFVGQPTPPSQFVPSGTPPNYPPENPIPSYEPTPTLPPQVPTRFTAPPPGNPYGPHEDITPVPPSRKSSEEPYLPSTQPPQPGAPWNPTPGIPSQGVTHQPELPAYQSTPGPFPPYSGPPVANPPLGHVTRPPWEQFPSRQTEYPRERTNPWEATNPPQIGQPRQPFVPRVPPHELSTPRYELTPPPPPHTPPPFNPVQPLQTTARHQPGEGTTPTVYQVSVESTVPPYTPPPPKPRGPEEKKMVPNRVRGKAHVVCQDDGIQFSITTIFPFAGQIFANDRKRIPSCVHQFQGDKQASVFLPYQECGIRNEGDRDNQTQYHIQVVVMFDQKDGSSSIQSFMTQCEHQKIQYNKQTLPKRIEEALEELHLVPTKLEQKAPLPTVDMKILVDNHHNDLGPEVQQAELGTNLAVQWTLTPESDAYGFHVRNCIVRDSMNGIEHKVIDEKGCSTDMNIFSHPFYDTYHDKAVSNMMAFKVPDHTQLTVRCDVLICSDIPSSTTNMSSCANIPTPPFCPDLITSPSNSILFDSEGGYVQNKNKKRAVSALKESEYMMESGDYDVLVGSRTVDVKTAICIGENCSGKPKALHPYCMDPLWAASSTGFSLASFAISVSLHLFVKFKKS